MEERIKLLEEYENDIVKQRITKTVRGEGCMNIWEILQIQPTKDEETIKNAYRQLLRQTNPEDDADGFKQLRTAYEQALEYCQQEEEKEDSKEDAKESRLTKEIDALYKDYKKRIDVNEWKHLFAQEEFMYLDEEDSSLNELLVYLMTHFHLPEDVFAYIDERFELHKRKSELSRYFPVNFLDYILNYNKYRGKEWDAYSLFEGDTSCVDTYMEKWAQVKVAFGDGKYEETLEGIEELMGMPGYHPFPDALGICTKLQLSEGHNENNSTKKEEEKLLWEMRLLREKYPESMLLYEYEAKAYRIVKDYKKAEQILEDILSRYPEHIFIQIQLADAHFLLEDYETADKEYRKLMYEPAVRERAYYGMLDTERKLIEFRQRELADTKEPDKIKYLLADSYYMVGQNEEAASMLQSFTPAPEDCISYYSLLGRVCYTLGNLKEARKNLLQCKKYLEDFFKNEPRSEQFIQRKKLYSELCVQIMECMMKQKDYEGVEQFMEESLPKDLSVGLVMAVNRMKTVLLYEKEQYVECINLCEASLKEEIDHQEAYTFYLYMAKSYEKMDYLQEALDASIRAKNEDRYALEPYEIAIEVFMEVSQYEDVLQVIEEYRQIKPDSDSMKYYEADCLFGQNDCRKAISILEEMIHDYKRETSDFKDIGKAMLLLADCYEENGRFEDMLAVYQKVETLFPEHEAIHGLLAYAYRELDEYRMAIEEYTKQIERKPHAFYYSNRGGTYHTIADYEHAMEDYQKALTLDPERVFCHMQMGKIYQLTKRYEEAVLKFNDVIKLLDENEVEQKLEALRWQSRSYICMNQYDKGIAILEKLLKEYGDEADYGLRYELALAYQRNNRSDAAYEILKDYLDHGTDEDEKYSYAGLMLELMGEEGIMDKARYAFEFARAIHDDDCNLYEKYARILVYNGEYEEAKRQYMKAVEDDEENKQGWYSSLVEACFLADGRILPEYEIFVTRSMIPEEKMLTPREYIRMGRLYRVLGEYDKALECLKHSVSMNLCKGCGYAGCEEGHYELGLLYEAMNDTEAAVAAYREALKAHGHIGVYERRLNALTKG